jgi:hypothetical protein
MHLHYQILIVIYNFPYTGHTQKNGAVLIVNTVKTAPFFCVCLVYETYVGKVIQGEYY